MTFKSVRQPEQGNGPLRFYGATAAIAHILSVLLAGHLHPRMSPAYHPMSDFGARGMPFNQLMNYGGFVVPGLLLVATSLAVHRIQSIHPVPRAGTAFMGLAGLFLITAGLAPVPSPTHLAVAPLAALSASASMFVFSRWAQREFGSNLWFISGLFLSSALLLDMALFTFVILRRSHVPVHAWMGIEQRFVSFSTFLWFAVLAYFMGRRRASVTHGITCAST